MLRDLLLRSRRRYRELLKAEEGIATNVLADRLKRLEGRGLIRKERDPEDGRQFAYVATPLAVSLIPILVEMTVWGARNGGGATIAPDFVHRFDTERDALNAEIQDQVRRDSGIG